MERPKVNGLFIHVGKTAGSKLLSEIKFIKHFHLTRLNKEKLNVYKVDDIYITTRDPLSRIISCWNYIKYMTNIYPNYIKEKGKNGMTEKDYVSYFNDLNNVISYLDIDSRANDVFHSFCVHHISQGYEFYLKDIIDDLEKRNVYVIRQECFDKDFKRVFGHKPNNKDRKRDTQKSIHYSRNIEKKNLSKVYEHLKKEYEIYYRLLSLNNLEKPMIDYNVVS